MTKIAVAGPTSGTGTFTLTTPVSSSDRTLTFPDSTGTVLNDQSNIEAQVKTATSATGAAPIFSCRSWVNFNGTGTVAIRASGNVSSITDNGGGRYAVQLLTAMPDTNFTVVGMVGQPLGGANIAGIINRDLSFTLTTSSIPVGSVNGNNGNTYLDYSEIHVAIFR